MDLPLKYKGVIDMKYKELIESIKDCQREIVNNIISKERSKKSSNVEQIKNFKAIIKDFINENELEGFHKKFLMGISNSILSSDYLLEELELAYLMTLAINSMYKFYEDVHLMLEFPSEGSANFIKGEV